MPGFVVGAGYGYKESISNVYKHCRDNEGCVRVFATDKVASKCVQLTDIDADSWSHPDFVLSVNTEETSAVKLEEWYELVATDTALILPVTAHPSHVRWWLRYHGGPIYWMVPNNIDKDLSELWAGKYGVPAMPRGSNSGEFAWLMASLLGCKPIGLIGMTYAWKTLKEVLDMQSVEKYDYHEFYDEEKHCYTTLGFMSQRTEFLEYVSIYGKDTKTYNLSEGGILYNEDVKRMTVKEFLEKFI